MTRLPDEFASVAPRTETPGATLRVLSLNIQVGLHTSRYRHYVTEAWRHLVPTHAAHANLDRIATLASGYDLVAIQEADAGSLRTGNLDQIAHLAGRAGFPHWESAVTRDLRPFAQHSLGCLSRWPLELIRRHALPGWLPGRVALELQVQPPGHEPLRVVIVHLALGRRARSRQLAYLASLISADQEAIVLGDLNCEPIELHSHAGIRSAGLRAVHEQHTFPSWRPSRSLDNVLTTPALEVLGATVLQERLSDHLAVATEIRLRRSNTIGSDR